MAGRRRPLLLKILGQFALERNRRFEPIFARSASALTHGEKSSINTDRKSPMRFPMILRWTLYVVPKPPKRAQKRKTAVFVQNRTSIEESLRQSYFVWKLSATKSSGIYLPKFPVMNDYWERSFYLKFWVKVTALAQNRRFSIYFRLSLIHIWRCRRIERCRSRWSPYH